MGVPAVNAWSEVHGSIEGRQTWQSGSFDVHSQDAEAG